MSPINFEDLGDVISELDGFVTSYSDAPRELRSLVDALKAWGARLECLEASVDQLQAPFCNDMPLSARTLVDLKARIDSKRDALQEHEQPQSSEKSFITAQYHWSIASIAEYSRRINEHTNILQLYLMQIIL